jgi:hypothetical protein
MVRLARIILLALALVVACASAAVAAGGWQTGDYAGTSGGKFKPAGKPLRKARVSFHVGQHRITKVRVEIRVRCADGSHTSFVTQHDGFLTLDANGKFAGGAATKTGRDNISGQVTGTSASGIVRSFDEEDANGNENPAGQKCDSGRVKWTAAKKPGTS